MRKIRSVLVTGGTGTFGRAFVRFLLYATKVERVCVYSRGEHVQAAMRQEFNNDPRIRWMIGDVRDLPRLSRAMLGVDAVVHAAALKRIETGAYNPDEMIKTNVLGTANVVEASYKARSVRYVVGLSSDKAYQPASPYGLSKALAESLLLTAGTTHGKGPKFAVVRYGNVTGSQGSVIPFWYGLIQNGATEVPVTDLDCTRFHMTPDEAVRLVWDTLKHMQGGELVIPSWLPAYRLGDLVEIMGVKANVTGLPKWEKLHESMNDELCSADARRLTAGELLEIVRCATRTPS